MVKILLHRVTTHKIHISTNDATLFILKWLQSLAFPLHVSTQHLNIKENVLTSTTPFLLLQTQLSSTSFLLLGAFSGKVPCSITTKTYYFWQVSRFPFWATVEVVPWLLAPVTGDMTQVLPGIQSASLPGPFHAIHGFYFLWVIFYFLCREFY